MKARKENKVYDINESSKQTYLDQGFDIYDDNGKVIEYTPLKTIKYNEHLKKLALATAEKDEKIDLLRKEIDELSSHQQPVVDNVMDLLKGYAENKGVDVGASTSPSGILEKILKAEKEM